MSLVNFQFAKKMFDGPLTDDSGQPTYTISTIKKGKKKGSTVIYGLDGVQIGEILWKRGGRSKQVTLHDRTAESLLFEQKGKWYKKNLKAFNDGAMNTFVWNSKGSECRTPDGVLVAAFKAEKPHLIHKNEPAVLSVDPQYLSILDLILFATLEMERRRQYVEKVNGGLEVTNSAVGAIGAFA